MIRVTQAQLADADLIRMTEKALIRATQAKLAESPDQSDTGNEEHADAVYMQLCKCQGQDL